MHVEGILALLQFPWWSLLHSNLLICTLILLMMVTKVEMVIREQFCLPLLVYRLMDFLLFWCFIRNPWCGGSTYLIFILKPRKVFGVKAVHFTLCHELGYILPISALSFTIFILSIPCSIISFQYSPNSGQLFFKNKNISPPSILFPLSPFFTLF